MALAQRWVGRRRRGATLAVIDVGSSLGIIFTGTLIPMVVMAYSWRSGWLSLGLLGFFVALIDYIMIRNSPAESAKSGQPGPGSGNGEPLRKAYSGLLRDFRFWLIGSAYLCTGFSILIPFTFLSTYAVRELSLSYAAATRMITVIGVSAIVGKLTLGPISDRVGRIRIMLICAALIAAGSLGMAYAPGVIMLVLFTAVFGLGYGTVWSMYAACASDYFPGAITGSIIGLWTVFLGIGSILSPIFAGLIADTTGTLTWSFMLSMASAVISFLLLVPVWRASTGNPPGGS
jgi:MFS family permease